MQPERASCPLGRAHKVERSRGSRVFVTISCSSGFPAGFAEFLVWASLRSCLSMLSLAGVLPRILPCDPLGHGPLDRSGRASFSAVQTLWHSASGCGAKVYFTLISKTRLGLPAIKRRPFMSMDVRTTIGCTPRVHSLCRPYGCTSASRPEWMLGEHAGSFLMTHKARPANIFCLSR